MIQSTLYQNIVIVGKDSEKDFARQGSMDRARGIRAPILRCMY